MKLVSEKAFKLIAEIFKYFFIKAVFVTGITFNSYI